MNMNMNAPPSSANAMGRSAYPGVAVAPPVSGGMRAYPQQQQQQQGGSDADTKQVTTEQIQEMLDENSRLIVDVITLNNQIKHGKGTAQLSEFTDKLDKKRKQLNANLMTLAKWADESSEQPPPRQVSPSPQQLQQQQQQLYAQVQQQQQMQQMRYPRGMVMNPMVGTQLAPGQAPMQMSAAQLQAQRYAQAQAQAQAYAQYQARLNQMGGGAGGVHPQYAQMGPAAVAQQQQQQRYHVNPMGYNPAAMQQQQQQQHAMAMNQQPQVYDDGSGQMGYQPQQQQQQQWAPN